MFMFSTLYSQRNHFVINDLMHIVFLCSQIVALAWLQYFQYTNMYCNLWSCSLIKMMKYFHCTTNKPLSIYWNEQFPTKCTNDHLASLLVSAETRKLMEQILASSGDKDETSARVAALLAGSSLTTTRGAKRGDGREVDMVQYEGSK